MGNSKQKIIEKLNEREDPVIFVLWGNNAIKKANNGVKKRGVLPMNK